MIKSVIAWFRKPNKSTIEQWIETVLIVVPIVFIIRTFGYGLYQVPSESMETTMLVGERFLADKLTIWFSPIKQGEVISFNAPTYAYSDNWLKNKWQNYVWGPASWTKRVIGIPGDHIEGKVEDGKPVVYRNGKKLDEPYINQLPLLYVQKQEAYGEMSLRTFDPRKSYQEQEFYKFKPALIPDLGFQPERSDLVYDVVNKRALSYPNVPLVSGKDIFDVHLGPNEYWVMGDNRKGSDDSRSWGKLSGKLIHGRIKYRLLSMDSDESWMIIDLLKHPIDFWKKIRWSRSMQAIH